MPSERSAEPGGGSSASAAGCLFGLLSLVRVRYNRNAVRIYLRDLGWSPAVLRFLIAAAISLVLLAPVLRLV